MARDTQKSGPSGQSRPLKAPHTRAKPPSTDIKAKRELSGESHHDKDAGASSSKTSTWDSFTEILENRKQKNKRKRSRSRDPSARRETPLSAKGDTPTLEDEVYHKYAKIKRSGTKSKAVLSPSGKNNDAESSTSSPAARASPQVKLKADAKAHKPKDDFKAQLLQRQIENMRRESEKERETLNARVAELEKEMETMKGADNERIKIVEDHKKLQDALTEAVNCHICFEPFNDPHILTCGHVACKGCFVTYFRSPAAYFYPMNEVPVDKDLSHFRKMCHICREPVIHRPIRMYGLRNILEALGIDGHMPSPSQSRAERLAPRDDADNPWRLSFPEEKDDYRQYDDNDAVYRCRDCWGEIDGDQCAHCGNLFSEHGSHAGDEDDMGMLGSDEDEIIGLISDDDSILEVLSASGSSEGDIRAIGRAVGRGVRRGGARRRSDELENLVEGDSDVMSDDPQDRDAVRRQFRAIMRGDDPRARRNGARRARDSDHSIHELSSGDEGIQGYIQHRRERRDHLLDLIADEDRLGDGGDYPEDPESEDESYTEEEYEGSFIDDNEVADGIDGNTTGSSEHSGSDVDLHEVDEDVDDADHSIEVPRARGRIRRRVFEDPDESEDF